MEEKVQQSKDEVVGRDSTIKFFTDLHPADIAELIEHMGDDKRKELFDHLNVKTASEVILELHEQSREQILETIDHDHLVDMVEEMDSDDAADLIGDLPKPEADSLLNDLGKDESDEVRKLLQYEPDTAGGIMQTELCSVREGMLIEDGIVQFIATAHDIKDIPVIYVIDILGKITGSFHVGELLRHKPSIPITEIMDKNIVTVRADVDQEEVARIFKKYDMLSLPVVDDNENLIGHILFDDIVDVLDEEASEDMLRIAGLYENENIFDTPLKSVKMRFPWLVLNLGTAILAASIIGIFEDTIRNLVILAVFMPIVAGMGGNAGTQALAVTIRGIALGELTFSNARRAVFKGIYVGCMNGLIVGSLMGLIAYLWSGQAVLGFIMFISMVVNLIVANLFGILIPLLLKWVKVDPAVASSVFLTSLTDCIGFVSFLGLSKLLLHNVA